MSDTFLKLLVIGTNIAPFAVIFCTWSNFEPTHMFFQEWFEIDLTPNCDAFLLNCVIFVGIYAAATLIFFFIALSLMYLQFMGTSIYILTPIKFKLVLRAPNSKDSSRAYQKVYVFETPVHQCIEENELILLFRIQQTFNRLINDICASVYVSQTQMGIMFVYIGALYIVVHANDEIQSGGILLAASFYMALVFAIVLQYVLCQKGGHQDDISRRFIIEKGTRAVKKNQLYFKFIKSCWFLKLRYGYPFYDFKRETFPQFVGQGIDFFITLSAI